MYGGVQGQECHCTIDAHLRTQIFEFPRSHFDAEEPAPPELIFDLDPIRASLVSDLVQYFSEASVNRHYALSPSLRHEVSKVDKTVKSQRRDDIPVFVVIHEYNQLPPVDMVNGECSISDEVRLLGGKMVPRLVGGRVGKQFITAWATIDGNWPDVPNNNVLRNMILAAVRVEQDAPGPIRKYLDQSCFVTDDERFVCMMEPTASIRAETVMAMDGRRYREKAARMRTATAVMERDAGVAHVSLLVNAMYSDDYGDDAYRRLHYLRLWQSLAETASKPLGYSGNIKDDNIILAGRKTARELREYRDEVAHWWTDRMDAAYLEDLQHTINRLLRDRYFARSGARVAGE